VGLLPASSVQTQTQGREGASKIERDPGVLKSSFPCGASYRQSSCVDGPRVTPAWCDKALRTCPGGLNLI
jgi:hypothetical protein